MYPERVSCTDCEFCYERIYFSDDYYPSGEKIYLSDLICNNPNSIFYSDEIPTIICSQFIYAPREETIEQTDYE